MSRIEDSDGSTPTRFRASGSDRGSISAREFALAMQNLSEDGTFILGAIPLRFELDGMEDLT